MNKIKVQVLNPTGYIDEGADIAAFAAKLSQHAFSMMFEDKPISDYIGKHNANMALAGKLAELPHYTLNRMTKLNVVVTGLSIRASRQLTRHQNDVVFMSSSLQYERVEGKDVYSDDTLFCVPSEIKGGARDLFLKCCQGSYNDYEYHIAMGISKDSAAYLLPLALRQVLLISATPYELAHIVSARLCKRNTEEVIHIARLIFNAVKPYSEFMCGSFALPECLKRGCVEGKFSCCRPYLNHKELGV